MKWLSLTKLFDLGISARQAVKEVSYPTTLNAFDSIGYAILYSLAKTDDILKGEIEVDEAYFGGKRKGNRGRGAKNKTIVFGILEFCKRENCKTLWYQSKFLLYIKEMEWRYNNRNVDTFSLLVDYILGEDN